MQGGGGYLVLGEFLMHVESSFKCEIEIQP